MKRIKKEKYKKYKGQLIAVNSPYSYGKNNVVLFYCPLEGTELYFNSIGKAKSYLDSIHLQAKFKKKDILPF